MTAVHASEAEMKGARELLRGLSSARQTYALYPAGHPRRLETARELADRVRDLRELKTSDPVLFVSGGSFYLGSTLLAWESLTLRRLAQAFADAEVRSLEFLHGAGEQDVDALVTLLLGDARARDAMRAVTVNRAGPGEPLGEDSGLAAVFQAYAAGLELIRESAARLLAGRPADMDATIRLTERLSDLIADDPAQALLLTTVKSYDEYTYHHMVNVCILSLALSRAIGLSHEQTIAFGIGGLLHDVGKVKVPKEILTHGGALGEEEWRLIRKHPVDGAGLIVVTTRDPFHAAVSAVLEHHAAYDGSGYPSLSHGRTPSLAARIVAVADSFDALTTKRTYRKPEERRQALNLLQAGAGRAYDPRVVRSFVRLMGVFPVGSFVQFVGGEVALVIDGNERDPMAPKVRIVLDVHGNPCDPVEVDLARPEERSGRWSIMRSLDPAEIGVDVLSCLLTGEVEEAVVEEAAGLLHEPAPGEPPPPAPGDPELDEADVVDLSVARARRRSEHGG